MAMFDMRRRERHEFSDDKVEYSFTAFSGEIFEADLINGSEDGLCMQLSQCLSVGREITVRNFMDFSARTAVVIWVQQHEEKGFFEEISDDVLYRVGLQFSD